MIYMSVVMLNEWEHYELEWASLILVFKIMHACVYLHLDILVAMLNKWELE